MTHAERMADTERRYTALAPDVRSIWENSGPLTVTLTPDEVREVLAALDHHMRETAGLLSQLHNTEAQESDIVKTAFRDIDAGMGAASAFVAAAQSVPSEVPDWMAS